MTADQYIGGRFNSTPEDHFYQDGIRAVAVSDDGERTTFEFPDGSQCVVDGDGNITAP
jgi:hypothetical protein